MPYHSALPPAIQAYEAARSANEQRTAQNLQTAAQALSLKSALQRKAQEDSFREEFASLGPNPDTEKVLAIAHKAPDPLSVLKIHLEDQQRQEAVKTRALQFADNLEIKRRQLDLERDAFNQRTADAAAKRAFDENYKTRSLELDAQSKAFNAQLRALGFEIQKQGNALQIQRFDAERAQRGQQQVQQLGTALERANLPEADAVLRNVEDVLNKRPDFAEYLSGPKSLLPDMTVDKEVAAGRQAFQKLFNITLKNRSGAAVTLPEFERLKQEFATGLFKTPEQLHEGVRQARDIVSQHYRSVAAGFGPETLNAYNANMRELGGTPLLEAPTPKAASSESLIFEGYRFPNKESLDAYRKAIGR